MFKKIRAIVRLLFFIGYLLFMIVEILLKTLFLGKDIRRSIRTRHRLTRWFLPKIGVRLHIQGNSPDTIGIFVCNHRSYLDPAIIACNTFFLPISKAEVANWPILGYCARISGVLFLKRENTGSRKVILDGIGEQLQAGMPILLFPEGTTHAKPNTVDFRPGSFLLAARIGFPVIPVMIEYQNPADYWLDTDSFLAHFIRRFGEKEIHVHVHYGSPMQDTDGLALMQTAKNWIDAELLKVQSSFTFQ
ncbi:MAG: lysophospholipid acyltransferase family protein [Saprospiraceae bacterium]|nr:lysophospholipid acyltransferase family protein [Saprospiraceae bacterium]